MSIRQNKYLIKNLIVPENVLVSVFDKTGLEFLINGIRETFPSSKFYSTGGTGKKVTEILGTEELSKYVSIEDFTRFPEMEGGLVKTLHPKIHAGLLGERGNPEHRKFIEDLMMKLTGTRGVYFDLLISNLYPFTDVVSRQDVTPEIARVNIDIGGPTLVRAAAKNWHSVAVLSSPEQYSDFLQNLRENKGVVASERFKLSVEALRKIAEYDKAIDNYFSTLDFERDVKFKLNFERS